MVRLRFQPVKDDALLKYDAVVCFCEANTDRCETILDLKNLRSRPILEEYKLVRGENRCWSATYQRNIG